MTDPLQEFEAALAKCRAAAEHMAATTDLDECGVACGQYESTCWDLAEAAAKHGLEILARLRAAEAAAPKWRAPTSEDLVDALQGGKRFLHASRYKFEEGWSPWNKNMTWNIGGPDTDEAQFRIADLPPDPPEAQP
jgi:hypothetical protein